MFIYDTRVVIRGGGDLGSGVALRLRRAGFPVIVLESPTPVAVRRTVALAETVYDGAAGVEEMEGRLAETPHEALALLGRGVVPVLVDPGARTLAELQPSMLVDAILAKRNTGTRRGMAALVIGLGPGFVAGADVHAVIETNRGPHLGRVLWSGCAATNTHVPGPVLGHSEDRVLRSPISGRLRVLHDIGEIVEAGDAVADVASIPVRAAFRGLVRGMARDGLEVSTGMKIGDLDPRLDPQLCRLVSDKSLAVAGGVLEAALIHLRQNET
jgi:xanthine dehydrogenase accessory factor